jgi:16S rRNA (cytidine1402-2'-O)-methyltransferase
MTQKSYDEKPALYLIPTPVGNMDDITLRAIKTIENVDILLTEDTRVTGILLKHLGIKKRMIVNNDHNEEKNKNLVIDCLSNGRNVGLVSDRGTPIISDPGFNISKLIIEAGYKVIGLPGATALIPALIMSGLNPLPFMFIGFLNSKETKRKKELEELKNIRATLIFYEAPHRIKNTLKNILEVLGDRKICISREISKQYEEIYRGTVLEVISMIDNVKGEIVVVVEGNNLEPNFGDIEIVDQVKMLVDDGMSVMEAIKVVSKQRKLPKSEVYNLYHK